MAEQICRHWRQSRASRGQIIILVALFGVALAGMVGLSIDLGYTFAEKRSVQNAADAAALAGAHDLTLWSASNQFQTANGDVSTVVDANKMNDSTTQTYSCNYVDDSGTDQGSCSTVVPDTATGVHVVVHETHATFFMGIVPFGPKTISTSASANAHVQGVSTDIGSDSPFILCGYGSALANGGNMDVLQTGSADVPSTNQLTASILTYPVASSSHYQVQFLKQSTPTPTSTSGGGGSTPTPTGTSGGGSSTYSINSAAYGQTFSLHGPQIPDCGLGGNSFKGLADPSNYGRSIPGLFDWLHGVKAGPTRVRVNGIDGCAAGTSDPFGCVLIVPIASGSSGGQLQVQTVAAFLVSQCGANCHEGVLLQNYQIQPDGMGEWTGSNGWTPGSKGLRTIRLSN